MAGIQHKDIVDPNIHEPKGCQYAPEGAVYTANGSGSGAWTVLSTSRPVSTIAVFTSSGSWVAPEGVTEANVWVVGRGGSAASDGGVDLRPQGGGGGGASFKHFTDILPGTTYTFTIDNTSTVFRTISATKGVDGSRVASAVNSAAPGTGSGGDINLTGGYGSHTNFSSTPNHGGGGGQGAGPWGGPGAPGSPTGTPISGGSYGGGGGGCVGGAGGAGGAGVVIIEYVAPPVIVAPS